MRKIIIVELVLVFLLNWLVVNPEIIYGRFNSLGLIPKQSIAIIEVIALFIFLILLKKRFIFQRFNRLLIFIIVFVLFHLALVLLFKGNIFNWVMGLKYYLTSIPILFAGYYLAKNQISLKPIIKVLAILILIQIPVSIVQFLFDVPLVPGGAGTPYDLVSGTMGGISGNLLGIILASAITYLFLFSRNSNKKIYYYLGILLLLIPAILGEMKIVFIYLILIGGILFFYYKKFKRKDKVKLIFLFGLLLTGFKMVYDYVLDYGNRRDLFSLSFYANYESNIKGRLSRLDSFFYAWETIFNESIITLFTGTGIGNASLNKFHGEHGHFLNEEAFQHFWYRLILETGFIGFLSFLFLLFYLLKISYNVYLNSSSEFLKTISFGFWCIVIISFIGGFSFDLFYRIQFIYPFSLLAGYIIFQYNEIKLTNSTVISAN